MTFKDLSPPIRESYVLSNSIIKLSIRIMWLLHNEQDSKLITTNDVFGRASNYLDIGTTKLRQLVTR